MTKIKAALRKIVDAVESKVDYSEFEVALQEKANKESVANALSRKISKSKVVAFVRPVVLEDLENLISSSAASSQTETNAALEKHELKLKVSAYFAGRTGGW